MLEIPLSLAPDTLLDACAVRGLRVRAQGQPGGRRKSLQAWQMRWPDRSGAIELVEAAGGALLRVQANRDGGWAKGFATRLARTLAEDAARAAGRIEVLRPRVLVIVHDPVVVAASGRRLSAHMGWHDPDALVAQYVADVAEASHGLVRYDVVQRRDAPWWPPKVDGFRYTPEDYLARWQRRDMHEPDAIDYPAQVKAFDLVRRFERDEIDEVWFMTFPYAGDWESTIVGRDGFWCNSPPVPGFEACAGRFTLMGFSYERDVGCMLENLGHRVESVMERLWRRHRGEAHLWHRFIRTDLTHPGRAECGNVHFAPNSERDYDWGNPRPVPSFCDDWLAFPRYAAGDGSDGPGDDDDARAAAAIAADRPGVKRVAGRPARPRIVDHREWGGGDMRAHHVWWLAHLPHVAGETHGIANHWWPYIVDPNRVP